MKYFFLMLCLFSFSLKLFSATYETQIYSIEKGASLKEAHLILLTDGHVAFLEGEAKGLLSKVEESHRKEEWVQVQLDKDLKLISIQTINPRWIESTEEESELEVDGPDYDPSIISFSQAQSVFKNMRRNYQNESQCYNRAHIWTYEEYSRSGLKSNKLFLFFTTKYIRAYRYHWWFHVTPMVYVGGHSQANWLALDRRYTRSPLSIRTWTNIFMHNNAQCSVVYNYSSYRNHQQEQWCYLIPTSMYFWQPRDIERKERTGHEKTSYIKGEVNHAYWEAF